MNAILKLAAILGLAALMPRPASADATIRQFTKSGGFMGMGAHEILSARRIRGAKSRDESSFKFTGAVLGAFGGKGKESTEILRVDLGKRWSLDEKKKKYTESDISAISKQDAGEFEEEKKDKKKSKPTHRIKSTKFDVEKKGGKKVINGFSTEGYRATFILEVEDLETGETSSFKMVADQWLTPWTKELKAVQKEETAFAQAYMKKIGLELSPDQQRNMGANLLAMLTRAGDKDLEKALNDFKEKSSKLEGYPIVVETQWHSQSPKGRATTQALEEPEDDDLNISGGAAGFLAGLAKKAAKTKVKEKARQREPQGGTMAFSIYHEVKDVSAKTIPAESFEIPEGYKQAD